MNKDRLKEYISHPLFISFILWAVLVQFFPPVFSFYRIKHIRDEYTTPNEWIYLFDFDKDNESEKVSLDLNDPGQTKIIFRRNNKILEQYNIKFQPAGRTDVYAGDYNNDGDQEFYIFTMNSDSIFLNVIDPIKLKKALLTERFIDFRRKAPHSIDAPYIEPVGMTRSLKGDYNDLIFFINTGFSKYPRRVYRYMLAGDSLLKSPEEGAVPAGCIITDINNDSIPEILLDINANGNFSQDFPYTDQYSWLMVLDSKMKFLFPPVKLNKYPSRMMTVPLTLKNKHRLVIFNDYSGTDSIGSSFYLFDPGGKMIKEKAVSDLENIYNYIFINDYNSNTFYFLRNRNTQIDEIDSSFNVIHTLYVPEVEAGKPLALLDANLDGEKEFLFQGRGNRSLIITSNNFKQSVEYFYEKPQLKTTISQVFSSGMRPMLYIQFEDYSTFIQFFKNPLYFLKYPMYAALYLIIFLFITLIARIQKYRLNIRLQTEKQIASLQMKAIKNQIDPHFTLNILNAIGSLYASENNRDNADYVFAKYARLIRQTVVSSDQIIITLEDELDFVKNYIDLELFRSNNSFEYKSEIDKDVDMQTKIPRMLIHTFVENAIKYGLRLQHEGGILNITVKKTDNYYQIIIEDNGPGMESQQVSSEGTGKGLLILNELIGLYYKLEKVRITYTIQNIAVPGNNYSGTRAVIVIPLRNLKSR
jgi:two-component sensor histidine kinase